MRLVGFIIRIIVLCYYFDLLYLQTFCSLLDIICYIEPYSWRFANAEFKSMWKLTFWHRSFTFKF